MAARVRWNLALAQDTQRCLVFGGCSFTAGQGQDNINASFSFDRLFDTHVLLVIDRGDGVAALPPSSLCLCVCDLAMVESRERNVHIGGTKFNK